MRSIIKLLAAFALMLGTFMQHSTALADYMIKYKVQTATAFFSSTDPSGCIVTSVSISTEELFPSPPETASGTWIGYEISRRDVCTETVLLDTEGSTTIAGSDFQVSSNLDTATLNTTLSVYDYVNETAFDVSINLTWTGTGRLTHQNYTFHHNTPDCHFNGHFNGPFRAAVASGTVSDGTTNFTREPSVEAAIGSSNSGSVSVDCD